MFLAPGQEGWPQEIKDKKEPRVAIMPRLGLGIEYGGFLVRGESFSSSLRYHLLIDFLEYKPHLLYMELDGTVSFGIPQERLAFNRLHHKISIIGYRYDLGDYYASLNFYHRCYNPFRERGDLENRTERTLLDAYYIGLGLTDKAMLVGQRDRNIIFNPNRPFEFLGRWHWAISLNRAVFGYHSNLDWLFTGRGRVDILRYRRLIPYVEAGFEVLGMGRWAITPQVEIGVRYHAGNWDFIPFIQWARTQEWPWRATGEAHFVSHSSLFTGGRLEFLLDHNTIGSRTSDEPLQFFHPSKQMQNRSIVLPVACLNGSGLADSLHLLIFMP